MIFSIAEKSVVQLQRLYTRSLYV